MRNGSVALVPIFLGIMILFWVIMFMGGGSDTLFAVNKVENLQHLQTKLLIPALQKKNEGERDGKSVSESEDIAGASISAIMSKNGY